MTIPKISLHCILKRAILDGPPINNSYGFNTCVINKLKLAKYKQNNVRSTNLM